MDTNYHIKIVSKNGVRVADWMTGDEGNNVDWIPIWSKTGGSVLLLSNGAHVIEDVSIHDGWMLYMMYNISENRYYCNDEQIDADRFSVTDISDKVFPDYPPIVYP